MTAVLRKVHPKSFVFYFWDALHFLLYLQAACFQGHFFISVSNCNFSFGSEGRLA